MAETKKDEKSTRWPRLFCAAALMMVLGVLYAWSIFREPLSDLFGTWTAVNLSWVFTITMLGFLVGGVVSGRLSMRVKHRYIVLASAVLCLVGFLGVSRIDAADPAKSLIMMYVFYGLFCGFGIGMPYYAILGAMLKWFPGREGLASGVLLMGFGFGGLVLGNIIGALIVSYGINRTFVILAVGIALIAGGGSFLIREPSTPIGPEPAKSEGGPAVSGPVLGELTPVQMVRTAAFVILVLWMISIATGGLMVMNSAASIAIFYGFSAGIGLVATVFNGVGRMFFGVFFDRFGDRISMAFVSLCLVASCLLMLAGTMGANPALIVIGLPLTCFGYGGSPVITSAFANRYFGPKNYTANLSIINLSVMVSSIAGPILSGSLQDMSGGSFTGTFAAIGVFGAIAVILVFLARMQKRARKEEIAPDGQ